MASVLKPYYQCIYFNMSFKCPGNESNPNDTLNTSDEKSPIGKRKVSLKSNKILRFFLCFMLEDFFFSKVYLTISNLK